MSKFNNLFVRDEPYAREVLVHEYYIEDAVKYLTTMMPEASEQQAREWLRNQLRPDGKFHFKPPATEYLERQDNGDRQLKRSSLYNFIQSSLKNNEIIAPTFTTYISPDKQRSLLSVYVEENITRRGKSKKEMFVAEAARDFVQQAVKEVDQKGKKLANNSISGAHVSASTPLFNKTAHSTLTSTCRTTSAYGNANNEKFLSGNRHYHNYQVVLNNIVAVVNNFDRKHVQEVVDKYGIHLPTAEQAGECVAYSAQFYWWDKRQAQIVQDFLERLTPLERAAFVYSGDAYHLRKHNRDLVYKFITQLSNKITDQTHPDPMGTLKKAPEAYVNLAHQICSDETMGIGKDYKKIADTPKIHTLACTVENIADTVWQYRDLIQAFWMPEILPASVAYFPDSIRRVALTSDTDSTIFTVQDWIEWYHGKFEYTPRTRAVYVAVVFLASATITHVLAKMSANLGIIPDHQYKIKMKSEFTFDVFVPTQLGKHYFACISCQEGNVYEKLKYEIKGAQLRSANAPPWIVAEAKRMMQEIIHTVLENKHISLRHYLTWVADIERKIEISLKTGELSFLRGGSIKDAGSYAGEAQDSPYQHHFMWSEVFAPKYGVMPNPPYDTLKISATTDKPAKLKVWLDKMQDRELAQRMLQYLAKAEKKEIGTFHLPKDILKSKGIPPEIIEIIDVESIQVDICKIFYVILECIGYYSLGDKMKRLVSRSGY